MPTKGSVLSWKVHSYVLTHPGPSGSALGILLPCMDPCSTFRKLNSFYLPQENTWFYLKVEYPKFQVFSAASPL